MTVLEVIQRSAEFLARKGVDSPRLHAELLLAHRLKLARMQLYLNFERELAAAELEDYRGLIQRRGAREPVQQIIGSTSFCGLEIKVNRDVLVPRPETELLAERAWTHLNRLAAAPGAAAAAPRALDFGTGSGCLAVALASRCPAARVFALEVSPAALTLARQNATRHGLAERIVWVAGGALAALPEDLCFDLVVSNPPYIPTAEIAALEPEVRDFEPRLALDGGPDGLDFYRLLAAEAPTRLVPGGRLVLEFGDGQEVALRGIFEAQNWVVEAVENDYTHRPRILTVLRD